MPDGNVTGAARYVTDHFATRTVLKRAAGYEMGWPVLNSAGLIKTTLARQPILKPRHDQGRIEKEGMQPSITL